MLRALIVTSAALMTCASVSADEPEQLDVLAGANRNACFSATFLKERRVLDNRNIVVWSSGQHGKSPYLVELSRPLQGLDQGNNSITFVDGDGDLLVCRSLRDGVILQDAILPKRAKIVGVTELDEAQVSALERKYNKSLTLEKRGPDRSKN